MKITPSIGVACITHAAKQHLVHCLPVFVNSSLKPRVLVVNSSSGDGTVELARELGAETLTIPRCEFNHGATRELARAHLGTDIVVMVTPDAYARDPEFLEKLVAPVITGKADVSYARQLPRQGAGFFERFAREFNYPETSHIRSLVDIPQWGVYTFFCSNSCAAWSNAGLDQVGGFMPALTNEDYLATAKILQAGGRVAYVAEAEIYHSHYYTLVQEFRRYFDTGYMRAEHPWVTMMVGPAERRGTAFAGKMLGRLARECPVLIPYALLQTAAKWLGFRVGYWSLKAPLWWKKMLSAQDYYWVSTYGPKR